MIRRSSNILWLAAWLVTMLVMVWGLIEARRRTIANLGQPEEIAKWQAWKAETEKLRSQPGPVQRKPIVSGEPPGLILMRDRFPVILLVAILMGSFFFGFLMMLIRGSLRTPSPTKES
jgi:hypothetical protein